MTARSETFPVQVEDQSQDLTVADTNGISYTFPCSKCKEFWENLNSSINVGFNRSIEKVQTGFENSYKKFYNDREWKKLWKIIQRLLLEDFGQPSSNSKTVSVRQFISMIRHFGCVGAENQVNSFFMKQVERLLKHSSVTRRKAKLSWFGGHMTKQEADEKLSNESCGTFLVRFCESEMDNGGFALAVKATDEVNHYVVMVSQQTCCDSNEYDGQLLLYKGDSPAPGEKTYSDLVTFVNDRLRTEEVDNISCTSVCPGLSYNADFKGYK